MKNFSKNIMKFKNSKIENFEQLPLDSTKVRMKIGTKNHSMEFKISKNLFTKLKGISEKPSNFLLSKNHSREENSKNILIIEFNTIRYQTFFEQMSNSNLNFVIYNRRNPAFWNVQSYNLIKQSGCIIETRNSLYDNRMKKMISDAKIQIKSNLLDFFSTENFFKSFFSLDGISFWPSFKVFFYKLFDTKST